MLQTRYKRPDLSRVRLLERLLDPDMRIGVLTAAAGFGKTTLVSQVAAHREGAVLCDLGPAKNLFDLARRVAIVLDDRNAAAALPASTDAQAMMTYALDRWCRSGEDFIIFENSERAAQLEGAQEFLATLLQRQPAPRTTLVCSRVPLNLDLHKAALPHEVVQIAEDELRFSREDLADFFDGLQIDLEAVLSITRGWPLCVRLVAKLLEYRPAPTVFSQLEALDFRTLYDYLIANVIATYDKDMLEVVIFLAALRDATQDDFLNVFGPNAQGMEALAVSNPLVALQENNTFALHPLVQESVLRSFSKQTRCTLENAARAALATDRLRAAMLFMRLGEVNRAAEALEPLALAFVSEPSDVRFSLVLQDLPRDVLIARPRLFSVAMLFNGLSLSSEQRLNDALEALNSLGPAEDPSTYQSIAATAANVLGNLGRFEEALRYVQQFSETSDPTARLYYNALYGGILARMGKYETALPFWDVVREQAKTAPSTLAMIGNEIAVHAARARGDRAQEWHWLHFTLAQARRSRNATAHALSLMEGIFSAWWYDEETVFNELSAELRELTAPSVASGTRLFREVLFKGAEDLSADVSRPQLQTYAYFLALSRSNISRNAIISLILNSAKASGEPLLEVYAKVAASFVHAVERERWLQDALHHAKSIESAPLEEALRKLLDGIVPPMFAVLERRLRASAANKQTYRFSIFEQTLYHGAAKLAPSKRELELLTYLAFKDRAVAREELAEALCPDLSGEDAHRLIRVLVARVRKKFGESLISTVAGGYLLGFGVELPIREVRLRCERCANLPSVGRGTLLALKRDLEELEAALRRGLPAFEWAAELEAAFVQLSAVIRGVLDRNGFRQTSAHTDPHTVENMPI